MSRAKRRYLLALVEGRVCEGCGSAPCDEYGPECGPCRVRRIDAELDDIGWLWY
jgi:hypothetical protein